MTYRAPVYARVRLPVRHLGALLGTVTVVLRPIDGFELVKAVTPDGACRIFPEMSDPQPAVAWLLRRARFVLAEVWDDGALTGRYWAGECVRSHALRWTGDLTEARYFYQSSEAVKCANHHIGKHLVEIYNVHDLLSFAFRAAESVS